MTHPRPAVLAEYTRSGFVETVHHGHAVVVAPTGEVVRAWGDPQRVIFPRSSNKPFQATAMAASGLDVPEPLLALAASSHSGEAVHLRGVRDLLSRAGLDDSALQTPADYPLDPVERDGWIHESRRPAPVAMNCSGKHAAMLLTCTVNGWSVATYLDPDHPLQVRIRQVLEDLSGEEVSAVGIDGCGAPVLALTVAGLARALSACVVAAAADPGHRVAAAMAAHPEMVGGSRRDVTAFMRAVPGLVAKDGAEGVYVAALADGTAIAIKAEDGSERARQVALAAILTGLGADADALAGLGRLPVLGGGRQVGEVSSPLS